MGVCWRKYVAEMGSDYQTMLLTLPTQHHLSLWHKFTCYFYFHFTLIVLHKSAVMDRRCKN